MAIYGKKQINVSHYLIVLYDGKKRAKYPLFA